MGKSNCDHFTKADNALIIQFWFKINFNLGIEPSTTMSLQVQAEQNRFGLQRYHVKLLLTLPFTHSEFA